MAKSTYVYTNACSSWGADMGRPDNTDEALTVKKLHLQKVPFQDGCYDPGGAYWGMPANLYVAFGDGETEVQEMFVRASSRDDAKNQVANVFQNATFYR